MTSRALHEAERAILLGLYEGWALHISAGMFQFNVTLRRGEERRQFARTAMARLRDLGFIEYADPHTARLTKLGVLFAKAIAEKQKADTHV